MKFSYKFSNLYGAVYGRGNLLFTKDGNSLVSPVGNRISFFDLKNNKTQTLDLASKFNITAMAISPNGNFMIVVNEAGDATLISLISRCPVHNYSFHRTVHAISFSPDGQKFAVTKENKVLVYHTPGRTKEFNPFVLHRVYMGAYDETLCLDWTTDSRAFVVGSTDMNTRVYGAEKFSNLIVYSMSKHSDKIIGAFFEEQSLSFCSVCARGRVAVWKCDTSLDQLIKESSVVKADNFDVAEDEEDDEIRKRKQEEQRQRDGEVRHDDGKERESKVRYSCMLSSSYKDARGSSAERAGLTCAAYHKSTSILCAGFSDGAFFLHEMPNFNMIHSLSIAEQEISSVVFNPPGDWIALGCASLGQLIVWEWQSETYVMKQQGHFRGMNSMAYSPDGQYIVTGGDDSKVKVWNTCNGFCFVTFREHTASVTSVLFTQNGKAILSASLDGTVQAFDMTRYRNFRTFASPRPVQLSCLAVDSSGDIVCAGGLDVFEVFVWSVKTGRLLEVLSGHEAPITSLTFPTTHSMLASSALDKTIRLWDVFETRGSRECFDFGVNISVVAYRPDGKEIALATAKAQILFWGIEASTQTGSIDCRHDIGFLRKDTDKISGKKAALSKGFTALCYSADGQCVLAGGDTKHVCIYSVADQLLIKKFTITCNHSLDGVQEMIDRRKLTEFGMKDMFDLGNGKDNSLPGVLKGDMSSRHWKPEVQVSSLKFSPTAQEWGATTTEGLLIYSLDHQTVFDPFELDIDITPSNTRKHLKQEDFCGSLMMALRLNEQYLIDEVMESTPISQISILALQLADTYVNRLLPYLSNKLEQSPHTEFYLMWLAEILKCHGLQLKNRSQQVLPALRELQKALNRKKTELGKVCDHNKYLMQYLDGLGQSKKRKSLLDQTVEDEASSDESDLELLGRSEMSVTFSKKQESDQDMISE